LNAAGGPPRKPNVPPRLTTPNNRTIYRHDCNRCRYLGAFRAHDLYYCTAQEKHLGMPTVIARFGNDGPDYVSGLAIAPLDPILARALSIVEVGDETTWIPASVRESTVLESDMWARTASELVDAMLHARGRAVAWKRAAKRIWTREVPDKVGRHWCAARDVKMRRRGQ
jgi:hypothetical protein